MVFWIYQSIESTAASCRSVQALIAIARTERRDFDPQRAQLASDVKRTKRKRQKNGGGRRNPPKITKFFYDLGIIIL
jgi:hypothetical protein